MALKLKTSNPRKPDNEDEGDRRSLPVVPLAALEEHRQAPGVEARRRRVQARMAEQA